MTAIPNPYGLLLVAGAAAYAGITAMNNNNDSSRGFSGLNFNLFSSDEDRPTFDTDNNYSSNDYKNERPRIEDDNDYYNNDYNDNVYNDNEYNNYEYNDNEYDNYEYNDNEYNNYEYEEEEEDVADELNGPSIFMREHTKNKRKSTHDKHTKPRPGRLNTKDRLRPGYKDNSSKRNRRPQNQG